MAVNKVQYFGDTLIDLTSDTVTSDTLLQGYTAHDKSGQIITGSIGDATQSTSGLMSASDKEKLDGIASGAEVNVQSNWTQTTTTADDFIKNKPTKLSDFTNDLNIPTYGLSIDGHTVSIVENGGSSSVTVPDEDTKYTPASAVPEMDGTAAVGTSAKYAREDHVHPSDTSRVPTTRTINGHALSSNISITASDVSAIPTSQKGASNGVAELDANGKVPSSQLPSYVDDVLEYDSVSDFPATGESGKIYIDKSTNLTYRWSGTTYAEISPSLALGETSSTAYRGDRGKTAYDHASAKGSAFSSGLYKITTNDQGHVTNAIAVSKSDITALGIPSSDTNTTYGLSISGHTVSLVEGGTTSSVTVPDENDNDAVTQTPTTTNSNYEVLFSGTADNTTKTEGVRKNSNLTFNPSTGNLQVTKINGVTVGSNPKFTDENTTYGLSISGQTISLVEGGSSDSIDIPAQHDTTYTFTGGTNGFTVTDDGGDSQSVTITPSIANNVTGSGNSGYLTKFNGSNTVTNGPQLGSDTTKYLRNDGTWGTPPNDDTKYGLSISDHTVSIVEGGSTSSVEIPDNNTTYTFENGTNGFKVTPSGGTAQTVTVTPSIANNITGSGSSGYIAKFNGNNTITSGPQIGSDTTKYLRNDGSWETPPDTKYTAATSTPLMDGIGAVGTSDLYARQDHVHPSDTSKESINNKVTSITDSSTNTQYPSAAAVYDLYANNGYTLQVIDGVAYFIYGEQIQPTPIFLTYEVVTSGI